MKAYYTGTDGKTIEVPLEMFFPSFTPEQIEELENEKPRAGCEYTVTEVTDEKVVFTSYVGERKNG